MKSQSRSNGIRSGLSRLGVSDDGGLECPKLSHHRSYQQKGRSLRQSLPELDMLTLQVP